MLSLLLATVALAQPVPQAQQEDPRPRCEVEGYTIRVSSVVQTREWKLELRNPGAETQAHHRLVVSLSIEPRDGTAGATLKGTDPVAQGVTDTGVALTQPDDVQQNGPSVEGMIVLDPVPPSARSIASLEGNLVLYAEVAEEEFEFDVAQPGVVQDCEEVTIEFVGYGIKDPNTAEFRFTVPAGMSEDAPFGFPEMDIQVALIGADGTESSNRGWTQSAHTEGQTLRVEQQFRFQPPEGLEPTTLRCNLTMPRDPTVRLPFRIENIPLPVVEPQ